jgi:putative membrane protein
VLGEGFFLKLIARWATGTVAIWAVGWLLQPHIRVQDFATAIWAGLALGLFNALLRPILVFFTLPATLFTFGLFLLVINAFILYLVDELVEGVTIDGFGWAFLGALLISLISSLLYNFIGPEGSRIRIEIRREKQDSPPP